MSALSQLHFLVVQQGAYLIHPFGLSFGDVFYRCGLLGRMGNNKQALQLIIQEENDVEKVRLVKQNEPGFSKTKFLVRKYFER